MEVAASLSVDETNHGAFRDETQIGGFGIIIGLSAVGIDEPLIVGIFVVITGDLLLGRSLRIGLNVRVKQATTVTHILQCNARSVRNFQRAVLANLSSLQVGLEEGAHLSITRTSPVKDSEMEGK